MSKLYALTEEDYKILKGLIAREKARLPHTPPSSPPDQDDQAPDIYAALVPSSGIPALSGDTAGSATCTIYRLDPDDGTLSEIDELTHTVYNLSASIVPSGYVLIKRSKFGAWVVDASGGIRGQQVFDTPDYDTEEEHISVVSPMAISSYRKETGIVIRPASVPIKDASSTVPIIITTHGSHGFQQGDSITIEGVMGNLAANGTWTITLVSTPGFTDWQYDKFRLDDSVADGAYAGGGVATKEGEGRIHYGPRTLARMTVKALAAVSPGNPNGFWYGRIQTLKFTSTTYAWSESAVNWAGGGDCIIIDNDFQPLVTNQLYQADPIHFAVPLAYLVPGPGGVIQAETHYPHGLSENDYFTVVGCRNTAANGRFQAGIISTTRLTLKGSNFSGGEVGHGEPGSGGGAMEGVLFSDWFVTNIDTARVFVTDGGGGGGGGGFSGTKIPMLNWQCINNVPTLTKETWTFVNGRLQP